MGLDRTEEWINEMMEKLPSSEQYEMHKLRILLNIADNLGAIHGVLEDIHYDMPKKEE